MNTLVLLLALVAAVGQVALCLLVWALRLVVFRLEDQVDAQRLELESLRRCWAGCEIRLHEVDKRTTNASGSIRVQS